MAKRAEADKVESDLASVGQDLPHSPAEFDLDLREWIMAANIEELSYSATLYRRDSLNRKKKFVVQQWRDEIPDVHFIGMNFGPGEYILMVTFPQGDKQERGIKSVNINIDRNYDRLRKDAGLLPGERIEDKPTMAAPVPGSNGGDGTGMTQALGIVRVIFEMLTPLITQRQEQHTTNPDVSTLLTGMYQGTTDVLKKSMLDNVKLMTDVTRRVTDMENQSTAVEAYEEVEQAGPSGLFQMAMPLIEKVLPYLLGGGTEGKAATALVQSLPQYQEITKNKQSLALLIGAVEKKYGKKDTAALLKQLNISRP